VCDFCAAIVYLMPVALDRWEMDCLLTFWLTLR